MDNERRDKNEQGGGHNVMPDRCNVNNVLLTLFHFLNRVQHVLTVILTFIVKKNILWLQVPVDDSLLMEVLQALNDLSSIIARPELVKAWIILIYVIDVVPEWRVNRGE